MHYKDTLNPDVFGRITSTRFYSLLSSDSDIIHMNARSIQLHFMVNLHSCSVKLMTSPLPVRMRRLLNITTDKSVNIQGHHVAPRN